MMMATSGYFKSRGLLMNLVWIPVVVNLAGHWTGNHTATVVSKPFLMPLLALTAYLLMTGRGVYGSGRTRIVAALLFGALGDILLMFPGVPCFIAGMIAFLTGHIFYYMTLPSPWRLTGGSPVRPVLSFLILAGLLFLVLYAAGSFPSPAPMKVAISVYACAFAFLIHACIIAALGWTDPDHTDLAGDARVKGSPSRSLYLLTTAGFALFAVSDAFVAAGVFTDLAIPRRGFIVMFTYILAQMVVSLTLSRQEINKSAKFDNS